MKEFRIKNSELRIRNLAYCLLLTACCLLLATPAPSVHADSTSCISYPYTYFNGTSNVTSNTPRLISSSVAASGLVSAVVRSDTDLFGSTSGLCSLDSTNRTIIPNLPSYPSLKASYFDNAKATTTIDKIDLGAINATQANLTNLGTHDTLYHVGGDLTLNGTISGSKTGLIFVDGKLNINSPTPGQAFAFSYAGNGLIFIVQGNINISQDIVQADGIYVSGSIFCSGANSSGNCNPVKKANPLIINGSVISLSSPPNFVRSLSTNLSQAAETIAFQPKYYVYARFLLSSTNRLTSEIYDSNYSQPTIPVATPTPIPGSTPTPAPTPQPDVPVVSLAVSPTTTISPGSTTLTWSATNAPSSCTASSSPNVWSGVKAVSGSETVSNLTSSYYTFSLYCTNAGGNSSTYSVAVTVKAPYCGDGICNNNENAASCPQDCPVTGKCTTASVTTTYSPAPDTRVAITKSGSLPTIVHNQSVSTTQTRCNFLTGQCTTVVTVAPGGILASACTNSTSCSPSNNAITATRTSPETVGDWSSAIVPSDGLPFIVYTDSNYNYSNTDNVSVAKCGDSTCANASLITLTSRINSTPASQVGSVSTNDTPAPSVALGADGLPVIAFFAGPVNSPFQWGSIKFVHCLNPACSTYNTNTVYSGGKTGGFAAVIVPADGLPLVVYAVENFNVSTGLSLNISKCSNADCSSTTTQSTTIPGDFFSAALGFDGNPIISFRYYVNSANRLGVIKCNDKACSTNNISIVDNTPNVGSFDSIAIGNDGLPAIAYRDYGNGLAKIAKCGSPSCDPAQGTNFISNLETPASGVSDGYATSMIGIGSNSFPVVAFQDNAQNIKYASCQN